MAIIERRHRLAWAVLDGYEIRATGEVPCTARLRSMLVRQLVRREKPTVVVAQSELRNVIRRVTDRRTPVVPPLRSPIEADTAQDLYAELGIFAPKPLMLTAARIAASVLLYSPIPPRTYAPRRSRTVLRSGHDRRPGDA